MSVKAARPLPYVLLLLLGSAAPWLHAQGSATPASAAAIFTCVDDQGRRITADRPIYGCVGKEQRILNRDGSLRAVYPPSLTADERAEREARERNEAALRATQADAVRRDRNLLARYPDEAPHRKAREAALDTVRAAMKATERRLQELALERQPLLAEAEFYDGKRLPPKLRSQLDANDAAAAAQRTAALNQEAELERINRLYDAELERLKRLWAGAAPGSLGPISGQATSGPVASSAASMKTSDLR